MTRLGLFLHSWMASSFEYNPVLALIAQSTGDESLAARHKRMDSSLENGPTWAFAAHSTGPVIDRVPVQSSMACSFEKGPAWAFSAHSAGELSRAPVQIWIDSSLEKGPRCAAMAQVCAAPEVIAVDSQKYFWPSFTVVNESACAIALTNNNNDNKPNPDFIKIPF